MSTGTKLSSVWCGAGTLIRRTCTRCRVSIRTCSTWTRTITSTRSSTNISAHISTSSAGRVSASVLAHAYTVIFCSSVCTVNAYTRTLVHEYTSARVHEYTRTPVHKYTNYESSHFSAVSCNSTPRRDPGMTRPLSKPRRSSPTARPSPSWPRRTTTLACRTCSAGRATRHLRSDVHRWGGQVQLRYP